VYAVGHPIGDGMIHEAMSSDPVQSGEFRMGDVYAVMTGPAFGAGMAGMQMAFISQANQSARKRLQNTLLDVGKTGSD
jgi:hypothetical protein